MANKTKSGRGGFREGGGRPSEFKEPKDIKVRIEKSEIEEIEKRGHKVPKFIREAMQRRLKEDW